MVKVGRYLDRLCWRELAAWRGRKRGWLWRLLPLPAAAQSGFGLLEMVVGLGLFAILVLAGGGVFIQGEALTHAAGDNTEAGLLAQQGLEATRSIQRQNWALLAPGTYGVDKSGGSWQLSGTSSQHGKFTREVRISQAQRDDDGNLVASGGEIDPDTYHVASRVFWTTRTGRLEEVAQEEYLTNWQQYIISETLAYACASESALGSNLNQLTPAALVWSDSSIDNNHFFFTLSSPTQIAVNESGDYLLALTMPLSRTDSESAITRVQAEIRVNGVKVPGGIARSSYINNANSHNQSSNHLSLLLHDLQVDDTIEVVVTGQTDNTGGDHPIVIDDRACAYLEQINDQQTVFTATATRTAAGNNLNQEDPSPLEWQAVRADAGYTHSDTVNSEEITFDQAGEYLVYVNIPLSSNRLRVSVQGKVLLNTLDNQVTGGSFRQGYIRRKEGDQLSSIHWSGSVSVSSGETLLISTEEDASQGSVTTGGEDATIFIQKLPDENVFRGSGTALTSGDGNWNPDTPQEIEWWTSQFDSQVFAHDDGSGDDEDEDGDDDGDGGGNSHVITVKKKGDYILTYNDSLWAWTGRPNARVRVMINGVPVSGAETKTHYVRGATGHNFSSTALVFALTELQPSDQITLVVDQAADSDWMFIDTSAVITLWKKDRLESPPP